MIEWHTSQLVLSHTMGKELISRQDTAVKRILQQIYLGSHSPSPAFSQYHLMTPGTMTVSLGPYDAVKVCVLVLELLRTLNI